MLMLFVIGLELDPKRLVVHAPRGLRRRRAAARGLRRWRSPAALARRWGSAGRPRSSRASRWRSRRPRSPCRPWRSATSSPRPRAARPSRSCSSRTSRPSRSSRSCRCSRPRRRRPASSGWERFGLAFAAVAGVIVIGRYLTRPALRARREDGHPRALHRLRAAARDRHRAAHDRGGAVDGARRLPRRRAARGLRVPPRARDRHRAVQGAAAGPLLHRGGHDGRLRPARRRSPALVAALVAGFLAIKVAALLGRRRARSASTPRQRLLFAFLLVAGRRVRVRGVRLGARGGRPRRASGRRSSPSRWRSRWRPRRCCSWPTTAGSARKARARARGRRDRRARRR